MAHKTDDIFTSRIIGSESKNEYLESLIRLDYEYCHPDETLEDLKCRARFSKEDKGLLRDWMALATRRATAAHGEKRTISDIAAR